MQSSYSNNNINYGNIFNLLVRINKPIVIVEFGLLDGYSLMHMVKASEKLDKKPLIYGFDIFDKFKGNHSNKEEIVKKFLDYNNVYIGYGDFYKKCMEIEDESISILHIDIANNGDVYEFAMDNYLRKILPGGMMILEGGSEERDNVGWMKKYNKPSIREYIKSLDLGDNLIVMDNFPSLTIILKD